MEIIKKEINGKLHVKVIKTEAEIEAVKQRKTEMEARKQKA
jgi:hypothetical protein